MKKKLIKPFILMSMLIPSISTLASCSTNSEQKEGTISLISQSSVEVDDYCKGRYTFSFEHTRPKDNKIKVSAIEPNSDHESIEVIDNIIELGSLSAFDVTIKFKDELSEDSIVNFKIKFEFISGLTSKPVSLILSNQLSLTYTTSSSGDFSIVSDKVVAIENDECAFNLQYTQEAEIEHIIYVSTNNDKVKFAGWHKDDKEIKLNLNKKDEIKLVYMTLEDGDRKAEHFSFKIRYKNASNGKWIIATTEPLTILPHLTYQNIEGFEENQESPEPDSLALPTKPAFIWTNSQLPDENKVTVRIEGTYDVIFDQSSSDTLVCSNIQKFVSQQIAFHFKESYNDNEPIIFNVSFTYKISGIEYIEGQKVVFSPFKYLTGELEATDEDNNGHISFLWRGQKTTCPEISLEIIHKAGDEVYFDEELTSKSTTLTDLEYNVPKDMTFYSSNESPFTWSRVDLKATYTVGTKTYTEINQVEFLGYQGELYNVPETEQKAKENDKGTYTFNWINPLLPAFEQEGGKRVVTLNIENNDNVLFSNKTKQLKLELDEVSSATNDDVKLTGDFDLQFVNPDPYEQEKQQVTIAVWFKGEGSSYLRRAPNMTLTLNPKEKYLVFPENDSYFEPTSKKCRAFAEWTAGEITPKDKKITVELINSEGLIFENSRSTIEEIIYTNNPIELKLLLNSEKTDISFDVKYTFETTEGETIVRTGSYKLYDFTKALNEGKIFSVGNWHWGHTISHEEGIMFFSESFPFEWETFLLPLGQLEFNISGAPETEFILIDCKKGVNEPFVSIDTKTYNLPGTYTEQYGGEVTFKFTLFDDLVVQTMVSTWDASYIVEIEPMTMTNLKPCVKFNTKI